MRGFPKVGALRLPTLGADRRSFIIVGRVSLRTRHHDYPCAQTRGPLISWLPVFVVSAALTAWPAPS